MAPLDRNLLFGVLALQMDLIDHRAFVTALEGRANDKSRDLAQILLDHRALSAATHAALETLVAQHLEAHGGSIEESLASLGRVSDVTFVSRVHADLARLGDEELATISTIVRHGDGTQGARETLQAPSPQARTGSRFSVLRPHAKGGLGVVSVARDQELDREVALKEIQPRYADDLPSRCGAGSSTTRIITFTGWSSSNATILTRRRSWPSRLSASPRSATRLAPRLPPSPASARRSQSTRDCGNSTRRARRIASRSSARKPT